MLAHNPGALATSMLVVSISVGTIRLTRPCEFPRRIYVLSSYMQTVAELQPLAELKTVAECQAVLKLENVAKYGSIVYELFKGNSFRIGGPRNRNMGAQSRCIRVLGVPVMEAVRVDWRRFSSDNAQLSGHLKAV
jgi:hypothetical protein